MNQPAVLSALLCMLLAPLTSLSQAAPTTFSQAVQQIISRPQFAHATFGVEIYSLDEHKTLFAFNSQKLFTPGSTTKLLTEGTALQLLGPDFRFHTFVYRTGEVDKKGTLKGNLVLLASGDPNLSNRIQPDGSMAFADEDHTYGGPDSRLLPGDPLIVLKDFAKQIAAAGIKHVQGKVLVDVSLFPEGDRELGTGVVISPISVNDNVLDLTIRPGEAAGKPAILNQAFQLPYLHIDNRLVTVAAARGKSEEPETIDNPDGSQTLVLSGTVAQSAGPQIYGYPLASPSRFASVALTEALSEAGVKVDGKPEAIKADSPFKAFYTPAFQVAEHTSAPLSEEVKVTLKVSHNLHASMTPFLIGALIGKASSKIDEKGFTLEHDFLARAGLDLSGASQADGAGGAASAFYTPDFMVHYLAYMAQQPTYPLFRKALPILGKDGTLVMIQRDSPAAGHVFAKTGTYGTMDLLNSALMLEGKGLAGYTENTAGQHLAFAIYLNHVEIPGDPNVTLTAGQALGAIAAAAYGLPIDKPALDPQ